MGPIVIVEKLGYDSVSVEGQIDRAIQALSLDSDFNSANAVFIKPNLTYPIYKRGVTSQKAFIEQLVVSLRKINTTTRIYIGEGEGGYNSFSMTAAMLQMGFFELEHIYPNVHILNLSELPTCQVKFLAKSRPYILNLPGLLLNDIDFAITCPLPKVHCMTHLSLSFKNQWGCLPDTMRLKNHYVFDEIISQLCEKLKFRYAFLDGKFGLDQNGPMVGRSVEINWFVASNSLGAFDEVVSEMMGFDWKIVNHLKKAAEYGLLPPKERIKLVGSIKSLQRKFVLRRTFWNYPALIAFRSRGLTKYFYLSKAAKPLHDIMYLFRKKPIVE